MKAHVISLVDIRNLRPDGLRGLESFRCKFALNIHFRLSLLFPFLLESYSCMIFVVRGCTPWREGASGGIVASEA
jgi:hypothetical protein